MIADPHALVSIIIPCYNAERFVGEAIRSALNQTYANCEVIVIDDGSTDESLRVIQRFGEKIIWETGPNQGACAARNRGLQISRGNWIQFLDADDILTPVAVTLKREVASPKDTVVCLKGELMDSDSEDQSMPGHTNHSYYNLETLLRGATPPTPAPLHRREDLEKVGGFTVGLPCCQEYDLHVRLAAQLGLKFRVYAQVGSLIRWVEDSLSSRTSQQFVETHAKILMDAMDLILKSPYFDEACRKTLSQTVVIYARQLLRKGNPEEARRLLKLGQHLHCRWAYGAYRLPLYRVIVRLLGFETYEKLYVLLRSIYHPKAGLRN